MIGSSCVQLKCIFKFFKHLLLQEESYDKSCYLNKMAILNNLHIFQFACLYEVLCRRHFVVGQLYVSLIVACELSPIDLPT